MPSYVIMDGAVEFGRGDNLSPVAPDGMVAVEVPFPAKDWDVALEGDEYVVTPRPASIEELRAAKSAQVNVVYERRRQAGFPVPEGPLAGQILQTRDAEDSSRWLILKERCREAIAAGKGDLQEAKVRTASNDTPLITYNEAADLVNALSDFGTEQLDHSWALKDAIKAANDQADLDAIDIEAGWP